MHAPTIYFWWFMNSVQDEEQIKGVNQSLLSKTYWLLLNQNIDSTTELQNCIQHLKFQRFTHSGEGGKPWNSSWLTPTTQGPLFRFRRGHDWILRRLSLREVESLFVGTSLAKWGDRIWGFQIGENSNLIHRPSDSWLPRFLDFLMNLGCNKTFEAFPLFDR